MTRLRVAFIRHSESANNSLEAKGSVKLFWENRQPDPHLTDRGEEQARLLAEFLGDEVESQFLGIHPISELWVSPVRRTMMTMRPLSRTPLVRSAGPYSRPSDGDKREREVLKPIVKTNAFEEGGVYGAEVENYTDEKGEEAVRFKAYKSYPGMPREEMEREFPGYELPDDCTSRGWFTAAGQEAARENPREARLRAKRFAGSLREKAAALTENRSMAIVAHYDFLNNTLNALTHHFVAPDDPDHLPKVPEKDCDVTHWRHFNTAITVVDIDSATGMMKVVRSNVTDHLRGRPELMTGFPLYG